MRTCTSQGFVTVLVLYKDSGSTGKFNGPYGGFDEGVSILLVGPFW